MAANTQCRGTRYRTTRLRLRKHFAAGSSMAFCGVWDDRAVSDARGGAAEAVESHVRAFFKGHPVEVVDFDLGPERREAVADLHVLVVAPGPRSDSWAYVTAGCWAETEKGGQGLEFVMTAPARDQRFIELMAMIAYYHCGGHRLDLEHSMPIGEPWVPGSTCDHLLISLPYLHGPGLEHCPLPDGHVRILWTLPVTAAEIDFRRSRGHEALERRLDAAGIIPTDPFRSSAV
ncbi:suppressor of fused domain protein [Streptomyces sp. NPDC051704]|uniref:suppressor of fused domain protein n=1 Tax=Streptomyces sp. NPDC051704 TaxID=3365671 RepID=UPI00378B1726